MLECVFKCIWFAIVYFCTSPILIERNETKDSIDAMVNSIFHGRSECEKDTNNVCFIYNFN